MRSFATGLHSFVSSLCWAFYSSAMTHYIGRLERPSQLHHLSAEFDSGCLDPCKDYSCLRLGLSIQVHWSSRQ